jgi:hypothetical protein
MNGRSNATAALGAWGPSSPRGPVSARSPVCGLLLPLLAGAVIVLVPATAEAQQEAVGPGSRDLPNRVLGEVPMSPADSAVQALVDRLDFDSYKELIQGLAVFGDRREGTERNVRANEWIEAQLQSWGYETERMDYTFRDEPRWQVYATKVGSTTPEEMVILGAHMDGLGGGEAVNDNASGTALVMEIARVLASPDVETDRSVRFALWNNEETGLNGARAYVEQRLELQGIEDPPGSGRYPEPRWIAMIQHDKVLYDRGNPPALHQAWNADVDVEYQMNSAEWEASAQLGIQMLNASRMFSTDYPAALSNAMSNTDSTPFMDHVAAVSVRENRRLYEIGWQGPRGYGARGSDPHWHQPTDLLVNYTDWDFLLGFNATQMTMGATGLLVGARAGTPLGDADADR